MIPEALHLQTSNVLRQQYVQGSAFEKDNKSEKNEQTFEARQQYQSLVLNDSRVPGTSYQVVYILND